MTTSAPPVALRAPRICPLCEASCGLLFDVAADGLIESVRANPEDLFSQGHSCAKGLGLGALENDPDRLRAPLVRRNGRLEPATWSEAIATAGRGLRSVGAQDPNACAVYFGNPGSHHLDHAFYLGSLLGALGTRNVYSPAAVDSLPKHQSSALMFGTPLSIPVPDLDHTDFLLVLGSNPLVSNGSMMSAPGMLRRLTALRERGGTLVVVDPVRTRTAAFADRHLPIRPGGDAFLLMALVSVLAEEGRIDLGRAEGLVDGLDAVLGAARRFTPETVAATCGLDPAEIRALARDLADARSAAVHGRIGTCTQEFGSLASWLVDVLNVVTGNLDSPGGAMFGLPAAGGPTTWPGGGRPWPRGRWHSRVRGFPEIAGELPAACLAEEIDTPGPGQVRGLLTVAGNPARSVPNSARLEAGLAGLDFMVSIDGYLNETTRHADVVLPPPRLVTRAHYSITTSTFAVRNLARYTAPIDGLRDGEMPEWGIFLHLAAELRGEAAATLDEMDREVAELTARRSAKVVGSSADTVLAATAGRSGPLRLLDMRIRSGPYGDRFGADPDGLTLADLVRHPEGIDFGPLQPRLPEVLRTPSGRIELAPPLLLGDVDRLVDALDRPANDLVLVNRRQVRGMNSWLHNALPQPDDGQCALLVNPTDAAARELASGDVAVVRSRVGEVHAEVRVTDAMRPGVVCLPHGWGHSGDLGMAAASAAPGTNVNALTDDLRLEPLTGTVLLSGVPVEVVAADREE